MPQVTYSIKEKCGRISEKESGWTKELNIISWNERDAKYDIRDWSPSHDRMSRGITFSIEEVSELKRLLNQLPL